MGRAKVIEYYNERYKGSLDEDTCDTLEDIISLDEDNGCFEDLKEIIYDLTESGATKVVDEMEAYGQVLSDVPKNKGLLRDEQTLGVAFMYFAKRCILGDSVGFGKTTQVAGLFNVCRNMINADIKDGKRTKPFRYLYLTEKNLVDQCRLELVRFTGDYAYTVSSLAKPCERFFEQFPNGEELDYSVVGSHSLLSQGIFYSWFQQCLQYGYGNPFDILVIDESTVVGNLKSGVSKNLDSIIDNFDRVVFLNATPFETKLSIFYAQLQLLDKKMLPVKTNFEKEFVVFDYRGMYPRATNKYKNAGQFRKLVGYRYFARTRKDKGAIMEDCTGRVITSPLSAVQKYWLQRTQMPQMVYDCPNYFDATIEFNEENVPKLGALREALREDCAEADSILIFVRYLEAQESLCKWLTDMGYSNKRLYGDTKQEERQNVIRGFKNGEFKVLVTNVQKGLNFGNCNYCIFYGFDPNPNKMVQFEGRITRSFDIVDKHVVILCSEGEELKRLNTVVKQRAKASSQFSKSDLSCIMSILLDEN